MSRALLLFVRFYDGRYHGRPEWPPSPSRLFQALIAAAAKGCTLSPNDRNAIVWLEQLKPPVIAAPAARAGNGFVSYVPNNDLDVFGGDPHYISKIRTPKVIKPRLFDRQMTLLYAWQFDEGEAEAKGICEIAERLYQLGRGVDMAWAWAEIIDAADLETKLAEHGGVVHRPVSGTGATLLSPQKGSFKSLEERFEKSGRRFTTVGKGRKVQQLFSQAPKPRFRPVAYDSPPQRFLFDLRQLTEELSFAAKPLARVTSLIEQLRDEAAKRLQNALPNHGGVIERTLIGRGASDADKAARIRIIPIPSIGSSHVVRLVRRVLIEVPGNCPLPAESVRETFSGLPVSEQVDPQTGEIIEEVRLIAAEDESMLRHYGVGQGSSRGRLWRTVTPAALSESAGRRRVDPKRLRVELQDARRARKVQFEEAKGSHERLDEEKRAANAIFQALRHAGISTPIESIRVQREPFEGRGTRAEAFAEGTRFAKERLWHVEIAFADAIRGPVVIGDGRYLGLGLMAPVRDAWPDVLTFAVPREVGIAVTDGAALVEAARRALMALSRGRDGRVPLLFSGHEPNGARAASGLHQHVFFAADDRDKDSVIDRLIVAAPWACDRSFKPQRKERRIFDDVVSRLEVLRAGRLGVIALGRPMPLSSDDPLIAPARVWESRTPYHATRHAGRRKDVTSTIIRDVEVECVRRGLPKPQVEICEFSTLPNGGGLSARVRLTFLTAVRGPLFLGKDSHMSGGVFACAEN